MLFHPHVHMLVTAGGLSHDGTSWIEPKHRRFLVPVEALSLIFRAKICAGLKKAGLLGGVPPSLWKKNWVVHSQHAGRRDRREKVLDYLARYVFRIAITNSRLESIDNGVVRFHYRDHKTRQIRLSLCRASVASVFPGFDPIPEPYVSNARRLRSATLEDFLGSRRVLMGIHPMFQPTA